MDAHVQETRIPVDSLGNYVNKRVKLLFFVPHLYLLCFLTGQSQEIASCVMHSKILLTQVVQLSLK